MQMMLNRLDKKVIDLDRSEKYILSLRLQPAGFSFSIHDPLTDGSFYYQQERFDPALPYYQSLERAVYDNDFLLSDYRKVYVLCATGRFTFVPQPFAGERSVEDYYRFCFPNQSDKVLVNRLIRNSAYNVFGIDAGIYGFLERTFGFPVFIHHLSPLCEFFQNKSQLGNFAKMYVQFQECGIDVLVFNKSGLQFANHFQGEQPVDLLYILLSVWQQLGLDQQKDELQFAGLSAARQGVVDLLKSYICNVVPVVFPPRIYELGKDTILAPFDLTALTLCEL